MDLQTITYKFLSNCGFEVSRYYFDQRIKSHPNYPSLLSFTDTLDELGITYRAVLADKDKVDDLSFPFLAETDSKAGFEIIPSFSYYKKNKQTIHEKWQGVALMLTPGSATNEKNDFLLAREKTVFRTSVFAIVAALLLISMPFFSHYVFFDVTISLMNVLGIGICLMIILRKLGMSNTIIEELCSAGKDSCDSIINSERAQITKNVDIADIGLIYFCTLLLTSVFNSLSDSPGDLSFFFIPCTLAFCGSLYSIYYQWKVAKSWCKMCLITIAIIWLELGFVFFHNFSSTNVFFTGITALLGMRLLLATGIASAWLLIKPLVKSIHNKELVEIRVEKWKRDPEIFKLLLKNQPPVDIHIPGNPFVAGRPDAPLQIGMISGATCSPCSKAHKKLEELYKKYPSTISYSVIFALSNESGKNHNTKAVSNLLSALAANDPHTVLDKWYELMSAAEFNKIYPDRQQTEEARTLFTKYAQWNKIYPVDFTPAFFINGHLLPEQYKLTDIETFLAEINEGLLDTAPVHVTKESVIPEVV